MKRISQLRQEPYPCFSGERHQAQALAYVRSCPQLKRPDHPESLRQAWHSAARQTRSRDSDLLRLPSCPIDTTSAQLGPLHRPLSARYAAGLAALWLALGRWMVSDYQLVCKSLVFARFGCVLFRNQQSGPLLGLMLFLKQQTASCTALNIRPNTFLMRSPKVASRGSAEDVEQTYQYS